jgi:hypothetical protein
VCRMGAPDVRCREFLVWPAVLRLRPWCDWNVQPLLLLFGGAMIPPAAKLSRTPRRGRWRTPEAPFTAPDVNVLRLFSSGSGDRHSSVVWRTRNTDRGPYFFAEPGVGFVAIKIDPLSC